MRKSQGIMASLDRQYGPFEGRSAAELHHELEKEGLINSDKFVDRNGSCSIEEVRSYLLEKYGEEFDNDEDL